MQNLPIRYDFSLFGETDSYHFKEGRHYKLFNKLGAHIAEVDGKKGVYFALWAPHAKYVSLIGDFNGFDRGVHPMSETESRRLGRMGVFCGGRRTGGKLQILY